MTHCTQFRFSLSLLTTYVSYDNYNSTSAPSLPHNQRHTLPSFTADNLRSAHAQRPQIARNTEIQTRISRKISATWGKQFDIRAHLPLNLLYISYDWGVIKKSWPLFHNWWPFYYSFLRIQISLTSFFRFISSMIWASSKFPLKVIKLIEVLFLSHSSWQLKRKLVLLSEFQV